MEEQTASRFIDDALDAITVVIWLLVLRLAVFLQYGQSLLG